MRLDRRSCRYRARPVHVGPSTVSKRIVPEDTCNILAWYHGNDEDVEASNSALTCPDPLGIDGYNVEYSLNKKERWTIPERLRNEIEELQDPHHNMRVSASTHEVDVSDGKALARLQQENRNKPALSYHTVSRDGTKVVNNYAKSGQARLQTLINPKGLKPWDPRKDPYHRKKQKEFFEESKFEKVHLPMEKTEDQKLHVQYFATNLVLKPSTYNKKIKETKNMKHRTTARKKQDPWMLEPLDESENEDEEEEDTEVSEEHEPPVAPSLASFLVRPPGKHINRHHRRSKRESYKDESLRSSSFSILEDEMLTETSEESETEVVPEDVVIVESPSRIVLVTALPQLSSRVRLEDTELTPLATLPVQPRTWMVHSNDTKVVLGHAFPVCIVAREMTEGDIGLFAQENCLSCADRWGRYRILLETDDVPVAAATPAAPSTCGICCRTMAPDTVSEPERRFALSCGHSFCTECWLRSISDGMKKGKASTECLEPSCTLSLSLTTAAALLDSASMQRYTEYMVQALLKLQQIVRCRDCSRLHRVVSSRPSVRCSCGTSICARCSSAAHAPVSCKAFRDYCNYMQTNGLCSTHVSAADAPIVRDLSQCPKCGQLGEGGYDWCRQVFCQCGERYCHKCSKKWSDEHWYCEVEGAMKSATMIDVSTSRDSDLRAEMLCLSIDARLAYFERRKEAIDRVQPLSIKMRKDFEKTFTKLSQLMELCYLNSTKSKRSLVLAERIQFAMSYFFNTTDKNRENLLHKTEMLKKILNDISDELFGENSNVEIVTEKSK